MLLYDWSDGFVCNLSLCVCSFVQADGVQSAAADGVQTEYGQRWDQRHHHSWTGIRNSSGVCVCVCVCVCVRERDRDARVYKSVLVTPASDEWIKTLHEMKEVVYVWLAQILYLVDDLYCMSLKSFLPTVKIHLFSIAYVLFAPGVKMCLIRSQVDSTKFRCMGYNKIK